jgi:phenylalanyl-tRNA synthetase beta chain
MKVPYSWLRDYLDVEAPIQEVARRLTLAGLDVESIQYIGLPGAELPWDPERIVVGEVRAVRPHPNADRLVLVEVQYGGPQPETVVTGAPSLVRRRDEDGLHLKVAFALEGAQLYDGHADGWKITTLKPAKVRGIASRAMVCSEKELGLSEEHEDIIYLADDAPTGVPLAGYLGDAVLDIEIKGPLGHLHSVMGIAREAAALFDLPLKRDVLEVFDSRSAELREDPGYLALEIRDSDLCPRYSAALVRGITVAPSPTWMQLRLARAGMRPISNIVDVTNYVMLELGQPLHAFDYQVLRPKPGDDRPTIVVRRAAPGEQMMTLDGEVRTFDGNMLLITDGGGPVAVAGVMGGLESEVTERTTDVLLEAANFDFLNVRRTSRLLGMATESGQRFGRRVDPELTIRAAARAAWLMAELGGGSVTPAFGDLYPGRQPHQTIELDPEYAARVLGIEVPADGIRRILTSLEFKVSEADGDGVLRVIVPSHRRDVTRAIDLVEEVGRIYGYDRFPTTLMRDALPPQRANRRLEGAERVRDILIACGLDEVITYSLVDIEDEGSLWPDGRSAPLGSYLRVRNPLSTERAYLRQTLLPSLLHTVRDNLRFAEQVKIFEIGAAYLPVAGQTLPREPRRLGIVMTGPREPRSWLAEQDREQVGYFDLKGVVETLVQRLRLSCAFKAGEDARFHPGRCAQLMIDDELIGTMGELHPRVRDAFDLPAHPVVALEFDLDLLLARWGEPFTVGPISAHPPVYEDLAIIVDKTVPAARVQEMIAQMGVPLVRSVVLFDVYEGEQVGPGRKSLAYRLTYQSDDHTLTDRQVARFRRKIVGRLERELGASLRG